MQSSEIQVGLHPLVMERIISQEEFKLEIISKLGIGLFLSFMLVGLEKVLQMQEVKLKFPYQLLQTEEQLVLVT